MDVVQPEASSSTSPPPVIHQATLVFDSGLSRERFQQLIETNGIVHSIVQRLMAKSGNNEESLRVGLVITAQDAPYHNPRALHSILPAYRQDLRRPSAFLTSLPPLIHRFAPQSSSKPQAGSILSDLWDAEDGLSISSNEPGPSDYFLSGIISGLELLDHHWSSNAAAPPAALRQVSPESALPMLSMLYSQTEPPSSSESASQYLVVLTEKASLTAIDADSRGSRPWAREDVSAAYDDVDWDNIGERCKSKDVACSCIIVASPTPGTAAAPLGRQGSTAGKLQKMCQSSHADGPDDVWFNIPANSDVYLTAMNFKPTSSPAATQAAPVPLEVPKVSPMPTMAPSGPSEAQIKYQLAQKQAMSNKMAQAAKAQGNQPGGYNMLASLISSGRLDPNIMAQLMSNVRSDDLALRNKAMQQLTSLMQLQASQRSQVNAGQGNNAAPAAGVGNAGANGTGAIPNPTSASQQQQFLALAAMQARQAQQAQLAQGTQQSPSTQLNQTQQNQQNQATPVQPQPQTTPQQTAQQIQQQQQLLLQRQQAAMAAQHANMTPNSTATPVPPPGNPPTGRPTAQPIWSGTLSWMLKGQDRTVIPVQCGLLSTQMNTADLVLNQWPANLEMSAMTQMNMNDLQAYVKEHRAPCVLFSVAPQADVMSRNKMAHLTASLGQKSLCAYIRFGDPGCGILLISTSGPGAAPNGEKAYRLLGVVCLKTPFNPSMTGLQGQQNMQAQQAQQQTAGAAASQPIPVRPSINGPTASFPPSLQNNMSPQFLQQAQLQSQLMQQQQQQQQSQAARTTPQPGHARSLSQNLGPSPMAGTPLQPQQGLPATLGVQQQPTNATLQQFANQPNAPTIQQQLQMRQLQAQAQSLQQPNLAQQMGNQMQQQTQQQPQGQPQQNGTSQFTPQQRQAIIKILQDSGITVGSDFDPDSIPRGQLIAFVTSAKERQKQQAQQAQQQQQAAAAAVGAKAPMPSNNLGTMGNYANLINTQQFAFPTQAQATQPGQNLGGLQGQFNMQQLGQNGQQASALGLFAAQQNNSFGQFQQ